MANSALSKLIGKVSCRNYKKTQQEVSDAWLPYLYNRYIVCANNKYIYPNIHIVIRRVCGQTWTRVRVKYYNY